MRKNEFADDGGLFDAGRSFLSSSLGSERVSPSIASAAGAGVGLGRYTAAVNGGGGGGGGGSGEFGAGGRKHNTLPSELSRSLSLASATTPDYLDDSVLPLDAYSYGSSSSSAAAAAAVLSPGDRRSASPVLAPIVRTRSPSTSGTIGPVGDANSGGSGSMLPDLFAKPSTSPGPAFAADLDYGSGSSGGVSSAAYLLSDLMLSTPTTRGGSREQAELGHKRTVERAAQHRQIQARAKQAEKAAAAAKAEKLRKVMEAQKQIIDRDTTENVMKRRSQKIDQALQPMLSKSVQLKRWQREMQDEQSSRAAPATQLAASRAGYEIDLEREENESKRQTDQDLANLKKMRINHNIMESASRVAGLSRETFIQLRQMLAQLPAEERQRYERAWIKKYSRAVQRPVFSPETQADHQQQQASGASTLTNPSPRSAASVGSGGSLANSQASQASSQAHSQASAHSNHSHHSHHSAGSAGSRTRIQRSISVSTGSQRSILQHAASHPASARSPASSSTLPASARQSHAANGNGVLNSPAAFGSSSNASSLHGHAGGGGTGAAHSPLSLSSSVPRLNLRGIRFDDHADPVPFAHNIADDGGSTTEGDTDLSSWDDDDDESEVASEYGDADAPHDPLAHFNRIFSDTNSADVDLAKWGEDSTTEVDADFA